MQPDIDICDMALGQDHDTPLDHWQKLCEMFSESENRVKNGQDVNKWTVRQGDSWIITQTLIAGVKNIQEQDKSSDIEQQPPFSDRKLSNTQPQNRGWVYKTNWNII